MANVAFKKGLLANLPSTYAEGTFYVTTDERAIYLDVSDSSRIRLGDFQEFATVAALEANANPSTTALYYVSDINCLAKWNGTGYVQINLDTGATKFEVAKDAEGKPVEGNAITGLSYNAGTRTVTINKGSFATSAEHLALKNTVEGIVSVGGQANVLEAVKVNGEVLAIDANKAVDVLVATGSANGTIAVNGKDVAVKGLGSAAYENVGAFDAAGTGAAAADVVRGELNTYKQSNDKAIADAATKTAQDIAAAKQEAINTAAGDATTKANQALADAKADAANLYATKTALEAAESGIRTDFAGADTALKNELNAEIAKKVAQADYNDKMGQLDKSIEDLGKEDEHLAGLIGDNANAIQDINGRLNNDGGIVDRIETMEAFWAAAEADGTDSNVIDTLKEIQDYIKNDETGASNMLAAIEANEKAIQKEAEDRAAADQTINQSITDLSGVVGTKAAQADLTALDGRVTTAEGEIDALQQGLLDANAEIAKKANASDLEALDGAFDNYVEAHANDYDNDEIDAAVGAVAGDLKAYKDERIYTDAEIDAEIEAAAADAKSGAEATAAANLNTAKEELQNAIDKEVQDRATAITSAIEALDSDAAAQDGYALTGITITDGKISAKTEAKFATEGYVNTQIEAAQLAWGSF